MSTITVLFVLAIAGVITYLAQKKDDKTFEEHREEVRKEDFKRLVTQIEDREDLSEYDENDFWELVDKINDRSNENQHNFLGVFKDLIFQFPPEKLVQLDNLILGLYKRHLTYEVTGATWIVFKQSDIMLSFLMMNLMMIKGPVFFKNACLNPDLLIGKSFDGIDGRIFNGIIEEVYFLKENQYIPSHPTDLSSFKPHGNPWKQNQLPSRFPKLWAEFA